MKVVLISGTDHKGSTYSTGRMLAEKVTSPENISEFFLPRDFGEFCCSCKNCFGKGADKCPHYEKLRQITETIDSSDLIILTSPVYVYHCTGQMKALLDHYGWRWMVHRPEEKMFRKQAVVVATAAGAGMKSTLKDMADSCFFWGIPKTYRLGKAVHQVNWNDVSPKIKQALEKKTDALARKIRKKNGNVRPGLKTKGFFSIMRMLQRTDALSHTDHDYWEAKGWLGKKRPWK